jgi:hypothetical protein
VKSTAIVAVDAAEAKRYVRFHNVDPDAVVILTPKSKTIPSNVDVVRVITTKGMRTHEDRVALVAHARASAPADTPPVSDPDADDTDDTDDDDTE